MSSIEFKLRKLLQDATFFIKNAEENETFILKCNECMNEAEKLILDCPRESFLQFSSEVIVIYMEVALLTGTRDDKASRVNDIFFQRINQQDQHFCKALLAKASIEERKIKKLEMKGDDNFKQVNLAFSYIKRALEIATKPENKLKYQFIVYNSSIRTWQIIRGLMRNGWSKLLVEIIEKISNMLEEIDDFDFNWRCRYLNALIKAMFDAEKKPEALKILDKLIDLTKKKGNCNFQETIFRNRIHYYRDNNGIQQAIKKEIETGQDPMALRQLYVIQQIKSVVIPDNQIDKELQAVMTTICPQSLSANIDDIQSSTVSKISQILLDRLAECGRVAIKQGLIKLAEGCSNVINRANASLRAQVWTMYTTAEILLKKPSSGIDQRTGMKLNTFQKQLEDMQRRCDALAIIERAMIANKKLADADIIIEGCYLIWNMSLPLLKQSKRTTTYRPFQSAAQMLEMIHANENQLRINLHLELAKYEIKQDFLSNAIKQLKKCLDIDYSLTMKAVNVEITEDDDIANFQRPQDKYIKFLLKKLDLKTNLYGGDPESVQDQIILDIENAKNTRDQKMRETLLDKALKALQEYEEIPYKTDPNKDLVEEEIQVEKKQYHLKLIKERKQRVLISTEMAKLALEENIIDLAFESANLAVKDKWDVAKDHDLIIAQSESHIILAKCFVEYLLEDDIEIGHKKLVTLDDDQDDREFTNDQKTKFHEQKIKFTQHIIQALKLGQQSHQTWLIFNASIEFLNNYLPIFKQSNFYEIILEEGIAALIESYECMNSCFENANFSNENVDYELSKKMNVFSNLAAILARTYEFIPKNDEAVKVCDTMLQKQLPSNLKKTFDSIKARITKQIYQPAGQSKAPPAGAKGAKDVPPPVEISKSEQSASEILGYLELIKNGNKDLVQKALDILQNWSPNENDELELELNAELWCRLGRLAIDQQSNNFVKIALFCAEQTILKGDKKIKQKDFNQIPIFRLRWYSVSECLYGESLYRLVDSKKQEKESQDKLLHESISHFVESCNIASKAGIGYILLETCKCMWNALIGILDAPNNRKMLIKPLCKVHQYLKDIKEDSDPDFLSLFYSALFMCIQEDKDWKLGEKIVDEAFMYVPSTHQKVLWEAKMNFLSKLGKNVLQALSNMKESNASLMAKVYVKLARSSSQLIEQHSAYNKAIEILRKEENVEVVDVLIEYAEWMQRSKYSSQDVEDQLLLAVDILLDIEPGWDEEEDDTNEENEDRKTRKTGKSKSSKLNKQSQSKKSRPGRSIKKSQTGARSKVSNASKRSKSLKSGASKTSKRTKTALAANQEEEGQPQFMNCQHYEKLIRIHSMLAMISHDSYKQREYTLDAHFFIMKMWEQTYQYMNAIQFYEQHKQEIEEIGYSYSNPEHRKEFFKEIMVNNEITLPIAYSLPEKPEEWANFSIQQELISRIKTNEDKFMISKYAFMKPELTLFHLNNIYKMMEDHYFSIQQLPILFLLQIFYQEVMNDNIQVEVSILKRARVLMNLGMKTKADQIITDLQKLQNGIYELTDEEKTYNFEKIKALRDQNDDMKSNKNIPFNKINENEPHVIEQTRIHQSWIQLAEEQIKWGNYIKAKDLLQEVNIHSRILKDKQIFAESLQHLSTIKYLEGESGSALKMDMMSHQYASNIQFVEKSICHTYDLLVEFNKIEDCKELLDHSLNMLNDMKSKPKYNNQKEESIGSKKKNSITNQYQQNNLILENSISKCLILRASLYIIESSNFEKIEQQESLVLKSFEIIDKFEYQLSQFGCNQQHIVRLMDYTKILQNLLNENKKLINYSNLESVNQKYDRLLKILQNIHENLTEQMYYIGIHQDSSKSQISLPLTRILGVVKLRIAQTCSSIWIIKQTFRSILSNPFQQSAEEFLKQDKVVATFMDNMNKQIEIIANNYNKEMNLCEKNIALLNSALNMLHKDCLEYTECLVEISRCKRIIAADKKHLRGQWRQDAIQVDEISMNPNYVLQDKDRTDILIDKELDGEVIDNNFDYKEEALIYFVGILENNKVLDSETDRGELQGGKTGKEVYQGEQKQKIPKSVQLIQMLDKIGNKRIDNIFATFSLEFAELRGNLNKEQAFYQLANYQYALSRQYLQDIYESAMTEKHPDVQRQRQCKQIANDFSYYTSPYYPKTYTQNKKTIMDQSKAIQIISQYYHLEEMKENLPNSSAYLIIQLSDDETCLYFGFMFINKDRKISYHVSKMDLQSEKREFLYQMIQNLAQTKQYMLKSPITIAEDLVNLEKDSNNDIDKLIKQLEQFFEQITQKLDAIINPKTDQSTDDNQLGQVQKGKPNEPKKDDKKAPAKAPPAKGGKGNPADTQLTLYESGLQLTTSGIESLVLLLDSKIQSLPFEALKIFDKIPVVARDFNLHLYMQRLKSLGHQTELHNNRGVQKENLSYIVDPPTSLDQKTHNMIKTEVPKMMAGSTWKGIYTLKEHQPSLGEWQQFISKNSLFTYFSMTCLLHKLTPNLITELSLFSQCKAMIIYDRMNSFKTLVDRSVITSRHFVPSEQPMQQAALFSMCGVNTIVTNHWSTKPENQLEIYEKLLKGCLTDGLYLGTSLKQYWDSYSAQMKEIDDQDPAKKEYQQKSLNIYRHNSCVYGVPIVRIV